MKAKRTTQEALDALHSLGVRIVEDGQRAHPNHRTPEAPTTDAAREEMAGDLERNYDWMDRQHTQHHEP